MTRPLPPLVVMALEHAEHAPPDVRAAALMRLARVVDAYDRERGTAVLERGLHATEALPEPARGILVGQAVSLAGTVSPGRAFELLASADGPTHWFEHKMLLDMQRHGHAAEAIEYLCQDRDEPYPFDSASFAIWSAPDEETRAAIVRTAVRAALREGPGRGHSLQDFGRFFSDTWRLLPQDEARDVLTRLVRAILNERDERIGAGFNEARFSSTREWRLFEILSPLRHLDPALTESLLERYPQLAEAAGRFPFGQESFPPPPDRPPVAEAVPGREDSPDTNEPWLPVEHTLHRDFPSALEHALRLYSADVDASFPNGAPRECWPSTQAFRTILYRAGQSEGLDAVRHLDRIPDPHVRLLSQIELTAALAGLPEIGGTHMFLGPGQALRPDEPSQADIEAEQAFFENLQKPKPDVAPSYDVRIARSVRPGGDGVSGGSGPDFWLVENAPLKPVLAMLYDLPSTRIDARDDLARARFDFTLVLPRSESADVMVGLMQKGVERHFSVTRETRPTDVDVLTAPHGIRANEEPDRFGPMSAGGISGGSMSQVTSGDVEDLDALRLSAVMSIAAHGSNQARMRLDGSMNMTCMHHTMTMTELCGTFESALERPLLDETGVSGEYAIRFHTPQPISPATFLGSLCERLGLKTSAARRDLSILVVRER